jgi:hypothetical protein
VSNWRRRFADFHRSLQRNSRAIRLDQEKGVPAAVQKSAYHSTLILGTSNAPDDVSNVRRLDFVDPLVAPWADWLTADQL